MNEQEVTAAEIEGELVGVHRKLVATGVEKLFYTTGDGSYLNVYDTRYGKLSAMSCGEHLNSFFKLALMGMGTQIHVAGGLRSGRTRH